MEELARLAAHGDKSIPLDAWADFKFQDEAVRQLGTMPE
jgi:hypothetical protein